MGSYATEDDPLHPMDTNRPAGTKILSIDNDRTPSQEVTNLAEFTSLGVLHQGNHRISRI